MPAPRIFISHSSHDADFTRELAEALTKAGADAWYLDQHDRGPIEIGPTVENELRDRNFFVLVVSPEAITSEWVQLESRWYWNIWRLANNRRKMLIVVARDFDLLAFTERMPYLSELKRVELSPGKAFPAQVAIDETLLELGLALTPGNYPPDVIEAMRQKYVELGAIASGLRRPDRLQPDSAAPTVSPRGTSGFAYPFEHGEIRWCEKAGAHPIWWGPYAAYTRLRSEGIDLGYPLTDELRAAQSPQRTDGAFQRFEGPWDYPFSDDNRRVPKIDYGASIYWSGAYVAQATRGLIGYCFECTGGTGGSLGFPAAPERVAGTSERGTSGYYQRFEGGAIHCCYRESDQQWHTHTTWGPIGTLYDQLGGTPSRLGFPLSDELTLGPSGSYLPSSFGTTGTLQRFEGGRDDPEFKDYHTGVAFGATVYRSAHGAFATWGGIGECYEKLGGAASSLGFPTWHEQEVQEEVIQSPHQTTGVYQWFEGGMICWCQSHNAAPIVGSILRVYEQYDGCRGIFGFPLAAAEVAASTTDGRTGWLQRFEGGIIAVYD